MWNLIPVAWRAWAAIASILAVLGLLGGAYLYVRHQGFEDGYGRARVECEHEKADQAAANQEAMRLAEKRLIAAADQLSIKKMELDDQLDAIDMATAADPDGGDMCLSSDSLRRLNSIR